MELPPWSEGAQALKTGRYRHYKGGEYEVLGVARHEEALEELVIYQALYGERELWARPLSKFIETVEFEGQKVPRFSYVGAP